MTTTNEPTKALPYIIYVLGPPAAGKGTACKALVDRFGDQLGHVSVGDLLRAVRDDDNYPDHEAREIIKSHLPAQTLVPADVVVPKILKPAFEKFAGTKKIVLVDGFPRDQEQERYCVELLGKPCLVLDCVCEKIIAKQRYLERMRENDNEALFEKRIARFDENHPMVVKQLEEDGSRIIEVGFGGTPDESVELLVKALRSCAEWNEVFPEVVIST